MGIAKMHSNRCRYKNTEGGVGKMIFCDELKHKKSWFFMHLTAKSEPARLVTKQARLSVDQAATDRLRFGALQG